MENLPPALGMEKAIRGKRSCPRLTNFSDGQRVVAVVVGVAEIEGILVILWLAIHEDFKRNPTYDGHRRRCNNLARQH